MQRDKEALVATLREKFTPLSALFDERERRWWAATESRALGRGGDKWVSEATGIARATIRSGRRELAAGVEPGERLRQPGAGRHTLEQEQPGLRDALEALVDPSTRGDPMSPLRWTCKSKGTLATELVKLDELGLQYAVAVQKTTKVRRGRGTGGREVGEVQSVEDLAFELDSKDIRTVSWREGAKARMQAQFAVVRVEPIPKDGIPRRKQWLVIEWPSDSHLPTKYALSTLPRDMSRKKIVRALKERWRTERAYEDLKGELGLDHYEGRSCAGWNHHVTMAL
jgi:hypothetical protein